VGGGGAPSVALRFGPAAGRFNAWHIGRRRICAKGGYVRFSLPGIMGLTLAAAVLLGGCGSEKGPAEQAIKAAEEAFGTAKAEAVKFVPDQVKSLEDAIASVKDKFGKGDYKAVLAEAGAVPGKVKELTAAAAAKKEELAKSWGSLSEGLPKVVEAIQGRVDEMAKVKKLPANLSAEKLEQAKSGLAALQQDWTQAQEAFKGENLLDAVAKAGGVKAKAKELLEVLGMPIPEALQS